MDTALVGRSPHGVDPTWFGDPLERMYSAILETCSLKLRRRSALRAPFGPAAFETNGIKAFASEDRHGPVRELAVAAAAVHNDPPIFWQRGEALG